jgi:uncharacterized protein (DUF1499 family)
MTTALVTALLAATSVQAGSVPILPDCPAKPNCVSSQATDNHRIEPFKITGEAGMANEKLRNLLAARTDTNVISADGTSIRVEFRTMLGFVDDGLFVSDAAAGLIHIRSAARFGYWDLGKNRSRIEVIRHAFDEIQKVRQ